MSNPVSNPLTLIAPVSELELFIRLGLALVVGLLIGLERETKEKPAGLRTNMLVSFGSALFVLTPIELGMAQQNPDILGRVIAGVIGGVSFIGAGTILRGSKVHGLTSAATIWISSALGIVTGCGLWKISFLGALITLIILRGLNKLERYL